MAVYCPFVFREKAGLKQKLSAIGFGFLPFFIYVDMQFGVANTLTPQQLLLTGALLVMAFTVKLALVRLAALAGQKPMDALRMRLLCRSDCR